MRTPTLALVLALAPGCSLFGDRRVEVDHPLHESPSGVSWQDILPGTGALARAGDEVTVNYTARIAGGRRIDSTHDRGLPVTFQLGEAPLPGWDVGVAGMRVGGERVVIVPPDLAYGEEGVGDWIPPNATLVFLFELIEVGPDP